MKRGIRYIAWMAVCLSMWIALMTACSSEESEQPAPTGQITVFTSLSRSGEAMDVEGEELKACLLFWREEDYKEISEGKVAPYLVSMPDEKIDYYSVSSGVPYDTKQSYPLGDKSLHVCGFAPALLTTTDQYKTLDIPESMQNGKTDFLSGDGNSQRVGKASKPFVVDANENYVEKNKDKQLEFCHLTSKIVVTAKRSEQMLGRIGVRRINVMLHGQKVPKKLEWKEIAADQKLAGYFPTESSEKNIVLNAKSYDPLVQTMIQRVDSCYVLAGNSEHFHASGTPATVDGKITMMMDISAELIPVVDGAYDYSQAKVETWAGVEVEIGSKTGKELKMGYKYEINIIFDISGIRLQGVEMEWEEGGKHYIPITPNPDKNEENKP